MKSDFLIAVTQLAAERSLPQDMVIEAVEAALVSAYKKLMTSLNIPFRHMLQDELPPKRQSK